MNYLFVYLTIFYFFKEIPYQDILSKFLKYFLIFLRNIPYKILKEIL